MKGSTAVSVLVLMLLCASVFLVDAGSEGTPATPQDEYPDADVIICEGANGYVSLIYKMESADSTPSYYTRTVRNGFDARLFSSSEGRTSIDVVMLGGSLGTLTILMLDRYDKNAVAADMTFTMKGGSVNTLQMVQVSGSASSLLPSSYYSAFHPIGDLDVTIGGTVREFMPTSALVGVRSLDLKIIDGALIHRLYPTGSNGSYDSVKVTMTGGAVGYMTNQRSYIGEMDYDFRLGSIDYLCIGADTEGGSGYYLSNLWTSYVQYDVDVSLGEFLSVGSAIIGSGIIDVPSVLCNGQVPETVIACNVNLDCLSATLSADRCFFESDGKVYRFSSYNVGGEPSVGTQRSTYYSSYRSYQIYGEGGIWSSSSGITVIEGIQVVFNTDLVVRSGTAMMVEPGAIAVNASKIVLYGTIDNGGIFRNNAVIEKRGEGAFLGTVKGEGVVAYGIVVLPSKEGRIDVMTESDDAVVLRAEDGGLFFNTASVYLKNSNSRVVLTAPTSMYIGGDSFTVGFERTDRTADSQTWRLFLSGFDADSSMTVDVTISLRLADGFTALVTDDSGNRVEEVSIGDGNLTFRAGEPGIYHVRAVEIDDSGGSSILSGMSLNIIVATLIVILAVIVVYLLLRNA